MSAHAGEIREIDGWYFVCVGRCERIEREMAVDLQQKLADARKTIATLRDENARVRAKVDQRDRALLEPEMPDGSVCAKFIRELGLSRRAERALSEAGVVTVGELVTLSEGAVLALKGFGRGSVKDLREVLANHGLSLGMVVPGMTGSRIERIAAVLEARAAAIRESTASKRTGATP